MAVFMSVTLFSFFILPLTFFLASSSVARVKSQVETEGSGENVKVETNIYTKANETEAKVSSNQPGEISVKVENGKVDIRASQGVTPTVIIKGASEVKSGNNEESFSDGENESGGGTSSFSKSESSGSFVIYNFLKGLFSKLFRLFHFDS